MLRLGLGAGLVAALAFGVWLYGNSRYDAGRASYKAEVEAATAAKNEEIRKANAEDEAAFAKEVENEVKAVEIFNRNASQIQSFALDQMTADALNAFGGVE